MQIISVLTALAAFKLAAALPQSPNTGVITQVTHDEIPVAYKVSNETDITARDVDKRAALGVFLCVDAGFRGACVHVTSQPEQCVQLGSPYVDQVSAVGPDQGAYCRFFCGDNCGGDWDGCQHFDEVFPGNGDLSTRPIACGPNPNDRVRSYRCSQT